jgi:parallel beta helix pectate lyase-like protein
MDPLQGRASRELLRFVLTRGSTMKRFLKLFLSTLTLAFVFTTAAHAQATRTWVSGVGDDANPCSRTAPCKTFAGAISKTTASGQISVLDPGGFGALTITKALVIDGDGELASVLVSGTNGINISAGPTDTVVLRNLHFSGIGSGLDGVEIYTAGTVIIDHCTFDGFTVANVELNMTSAGYVVIQDSTMTGGAQGVVIDGTSGPAPVTALLKNVTIQNAPIALHTLRGHIDVTHSNFQHNATNGALAEAGSINLEDSVFSEDGTAVDAKPGAMVTFSDVDFFNNGVAIGSSGGVLASGGNNRLAGNTTPGTRTANLTVQ